MGNLVGRTSIGRSATYSLNLDAVDVHTTNICGQNNITISSYRSDVCYFICRSSIKRTRNRSNVCCIQTTSNVSFTSTATNSYFLTSLQTWNSQYNSVSIQFQTRISIVQTHLSLSFIFCCRSTSSKLQALSISQF